MKILLISLGFLLTGLATKAQTANQPCPAECTPLNIGEYKSGMRFYFPTIAALVETNPIYPEFSREELDSSDAGKPEQVRYCDLEGKTFEIRNAEPPLENKNYHGGNYRTYEFILDNVEFKESFVYAVVIDKRRLNSPKATQSAADQLFIRGAVYLDEVQQAQQLVGKTFYTLFYLRGKRDEQVTITNIVPGHWETPLRIYLRSREQADTTIEVNICGTNVPGTLVKPFHFSTLLACESKQGSISPDRWEVIRGGKPKIGMTISEVRLALGKPKQMKETVTGTGIATEFAYPGYRLFFEGGKLIKIETGS